MSNRGYSRVVPPWEKLPRHVQDDLRGANFEYWYRDPSNNETGRLTLLNGYLKLRNLDLWKYVNGPAQLPHETTPGNLEFLTMRPGELRKHLTDRPEFTSPSSGTKWESRDKETDSQLHLKHFDGWQPNRVQAHIDPSGFVWKKPWSIVPHLWDYSGYKNPQSIRKQLDRQGYASWLDFEIGPQPQSLGTCKHPSAIDRQAPMSYTVRHGDNLTRIAQRHGTTVNQLYNANRHIIGPNKNLIHPGQQFVIPGTSGGSSLGKGLSATTRPSALDRQSPMSYTVRRGDNLTSIAQRYKTTVNELYNANRHIIGSNKNLIHPGQQFTIPRTTGGTLGMGLGGVRPTTLDRQSPMSYTVQRGDNLTRIAQRYGTTVNELYNANRHTIGPNKNLIHPGQQFVIPGF